MSEIRFDEDGHVHFTDSDREDFFEKVWQFGEELSGTYPERSDQLEAAQDIEFGHEPVDSLNRFGEKE
jgi:hypothetical protein